MVNHLNHLGPHSGSVGTVQSTANLVNCILGAGLVALPFCYLSCGLVLATVLMVVCGLACRFSYALLLYCRTLSNKKSFEDMADEAVGPWGRQAVRWSEAALNLGTCVAYLNILADVMSSVAGTLIPPGAEPSRAEYMAGVTVLAALPAALIVRDPQTISALSTAAVAFLFVFAVVMMVLALTAGDDLGSLLMWRWDGLLMSFPVMAYGYTAHSDYLGIYTDMRNPTTTRMLQVTDSALGIASALYAVVGVSGYVQWQQRTAGDLLRNLGGAGQAGSVRGAYERALKACYGLSILGCIPMMITPFYALLLPPPELPHHAGGVGAAGGASGKLASEHGGKAHKVGGRLHAVPEGGSSSLSSSSSGREGELIDEVNPLLQLQHRSSTSPSRASTGAASVQPVQHLSRRVATMRSHQGGHHAATPFASAAGSDYKPVSGYDEDSVGLGAGGTTTSSSSPNGTLRGGGHAAEAHAHTHPSATGSSGTLSGGGAGKQGASVALVSSGRQQSDMSAYYLYMLVQPSFMQHAYTVVVVLGVSLLCTTWVPNVEFMMGLTGSTASVVLAYLMPALTLLQLMKKAPELDHHAPASLMLPAHVRKSWAWRKRGAIGLLVFGVVTGVVCTQAVLVAVQEEAEVVVLAQKLASQEVVAAETQAAKAKAQEAAATVAAVEAAAQKLGQTQTSANSTLNRLQQAAVTLQAVANASAAGAAGAKPGGAGSGWGIGSWVEDKKAAAAETKALKGVEAQLKIVRDQVRASMAEVGEVLGALDAALEQLAADEAARQSAAAAGGSAGGGKAGSVAQRTSQLAAELTKYDKKWGFGGSGSTDSKAKEGAAANATAAERPLAQVRSQVSATLAALNQTLGVLEQVSGAVTAARKANKKDAEVRADAAAAMQAALNATATSQLALGVTQQVLKASASQEADELVAALTKVTAELQRARAASGGAVIKQVVTSGGGGDEASGASGAGKGGSGTGSAGSGTATTDQSMSDTPHAPPGRAPPPPPKSSTGAASGTDVVASGTAALSAEKIKEIQEAVTKLDAVTKSGSTSAAATATGAASSTSSSTGAASGAAGGAAASTAGSVDVGSATKGATAGHSSAGSATGSAPGSRARPPKPSRSGSSPSAAATTGHRGKSGTATGAGDAAGAAGGDTASPPPSHVSEVLAGAVQVAEGAHAEVVQEIAGTIQQSAQESDKVAERVESIAEGLIEEGIEVSKAEAGAAAAAAAAGKAAAQEPAVVGPIVKVLTDGQLVQLDAVPPTSPGSEADAGGGLSDTAAATDTSGAAGKATGAGHDAAVSDRAKGTQKGDAREQGGVHADDSQHQDEGDTWEEVEGDGDGDEGAAAHTKDEKELRKRRKLVNSRKLIVR
uniref:Amino acid transporter transmembrane domain-containing protein n=1 Tax=Chlamydomonas leiostraca TaxID=1034604 RepID=A0A7S0RDG9_9CHLO|mmetsp:Transcript_20079/g.50922  ORF Transcript_20079/g.50922 Transcript_20079/m.50922 type:complete len:1364 (+) Transcript_20079:298-4389(+)